MLKKVPVAALRMGMHLHKLEGSWLAHPFWKSRFVIDSADDLRALHQCGVAECWIDTDLGLEEQPERGPVSPVTPVAQPPLPDDAAGLQLEAPSAGATAAERTPSPPAALPRRGQEVPLQAELREAASICGRAREVVSSLFSEARMGRVVQAEACLPLVEDITQSVARNPGAMVSLARLKTKNDYSYMHSVAVCALMVALSRHMGMDDEECRSAGMAGLLHDLGKVLVPESILDKPSRLTTEEFDEMKKHPVYGHELLLQAGHRHPGALDVVLHHHERPDGKGYPFGLAGAQVSKLARMGAVCDVYDAITSNRPYKAGWDPAESISKMASWKGQFDEAIFASLVQSLGIYPIGSLVRLESGYLAVVTAQNPGVLLAPVVKLFFSVKSQMQIAPRVLDLSRPGTQDRIVARETRAPGQFPGLEELWADPEVLRRSRMESA